MPRLFRQCQAYHGPRRCPERGYAVDLRIPEIDLVVYLCQDCAEYVLDTRFHGTRKAH